MTNSSNHSTIASLQSLHDSPELTLGIDGRPWGSRAILSRSSRDEDLDGIIDSFEVSDDSGLWNRLKDLVVRVEEAYGRVPIAVRIAALPDRSHSYELEKLRKHLASGSTVDIVSVDANYTRRPRANDSAEIKLKSEKESAMLAVGVASLRGPGDTLEIGDQQLTGLAEGASSDSPVDLRPEASTDERDREPAMAGSKPLLVAVSAGVMAVLAVTGILGYRSAQEPDPVPTATSVVDQPEPTPSTEVVPSTVPTTVSPTTVAPTTVPATTPPTTVPAESDKPVNGGAIDLGFLNDVLPSTTVPAESDKPVNGGAIDLGFLNDVPAPSTTVAPLEPPAEPADKPANGGPIDLSFLDEEPDAGSIDLSFLPPAE